MDEQEFQLLLPKLEGSTLDFKSKAYNFSYEPDCAKFVKDILCMANTPREETAHIVLGVKKNTDGSYELWGVNQHPDDEILQSQFTERVRPLPSFRYDVVSHQGKSFGVISILPDHSGPYLPLKDFPTPKEGRSQTILRQNQVYFRRGSKNDLATTEDLRYILHWMISGSAQPSFPLETRGEEWEEFIKVTYKFNFARRYILLTAPISPKYTETEYISVFGKLPWSFVLDFDPESEMTGLLKTTKSALEERRNLHYVVFREKPVINADKATYWYFARGLTGRAETVSTGSWYDWKTLYRNDLSEQFKRIAAAINPLPVTCVVLWYDNPGLMQHLRSALENALETLQDIEFVIATEHPADLQPVAADFNAKLIDIPFHQLCSGLQSQVESEGTHSEEHICTLPSSSTAPLLLDAKTRQKLEEELDLVDLTIGTHPPFPEYTRRDFLRGLETEISWYGLYNQYDVQRDKGDKIRRDIEDLLRRRRTKTISLSHDAGAGGTTLARRIIWDLHRLYPTAILHRFTSGETVERLYMLASLTGLSILLLIDGSEITDGQVEDLESQLRSRQVPVILFRVLRRFREQNDNERHNERNYLATRLTGGDPLRFIDALSHEIPDKRQALEQLKTSNDERKCSAFYFCLETFGQDFRGLERYVSSRLDNLTPTQKQIVVFLAIAHHYGQRAIRAQAFVEILHIPKQRIVNMKEALPPATRELLVEGQDGTWRTVHDYLAVEILRQILWPGSNRERNWTQNLSTWGKDFARFCRGSFAIPSEEMLDLANQVFIIRDNTDFLGTERSASQKFSHLIEDIPSMAGKIEVLRELANLYDTEAHFWAHLGRFYAVVVRDFQKSLEYVEHALKLKWKDRVLHHMKGMALRYQVYQLLDSRAPMSEIVECVKLASQSFEEARTQGPDDPHGYISEVEMLVRVLDNVGRQQTDGDLYSYLQSAGADLFFKECLGRAEELLEQVRRMREGEEPSAFEDKCRAGLDSLYGNYDKALQVWDNLLRRQDTNHPPLRRQIVWTYLARKGREWYRLDARTIDRIITLLEENLLEEPHSDKNLSLWVQAVRRSKSPPSIEGVIEKVGYWKTNSETLDSLYYLYVCNMLLVLDNSIVARDETKRFIDDCSRMARARRNRTKSLEWLGNGSGINKLVYYSELGRWITDQATGRGFWSNTHLLARVKGRISRYDGPQAGQIEVAGSGIHAFFVPTRENVARGTIDGKVVHGPFTRDDLGKAVDFYLGFSYDGLRAWEVREIDNLKK